MTEPDYDPQADISGSFETALRVKRERGDKHYRVESPIKREVVIGDCRLLLGDMRKILPILGRFDLCLTDPPYGEGRSAGTGKYGREKWQQGDKGWDSKPIDDSDIKLLVACAQHAIVWGGNYFELPPSRGFLVWDKGAGFKGRDFAECELAWTSFDANAKVLTRDPLARGDYKGKVHPTQKPVAVMDWSLDFAPSARSVVDPFMGSGSTLIACAKRGIPATGIEIDPDYFEAACARLEEPGMFRARPPEPIQQPLFSEVTE